MTFASLVVNVKAGSGVLILPSLAFFENAGEAAKGSASRPVL